MLDILQFIKEKGGDPDQIRKSQAAGEPALNLLTRSSMSTKNGP